MATMTGTTTGSQTETWGGSSTSPSITRISGNIHGFSWSRSQTLQPEFVFERYETTPARVQVASDEVTRANDEATPTSDDVTPTSDEVAPASDEMAAASDEVTPANDEVTQRGSRVIPTGVQVAPTSSLVVATSAQTFPTNAQTIPMNTQRILTNAQGPPANDEPTPASVQVPLASGRGTAAEPPPRVSGSSTGGFLGRYTKVMILDVVVTIVLMWICLPIFWSSLSREHSDLDPLVAWFVNLESHGELGAAFNEAIFGASRENKSTLTWKEIHMVPGEEEKIVDRVMGGEAWVAVVVSPNATSALDEARQLGDVDYDPAGAVTVYYVSARHEIAMMTYILPAVRPLLVDTMNVFATRSTQVYISSLVSQNGTVNSTALDAISRAPQTISPGVSWKDVDLSEQTVSASQAVTFVGLIYICSIAYITVLTHIREISYIKDRMTLSSFRNVSFFAPIIAYIPLSLNYTLINLSFRLPFGEKFTGVGGFFLFSIYTYLGMCALGLALEVVTLVLTSDYAIFFFVLWLTTNLSTIVLPTELQPPIFRYGVVFPFKNIEQAVRSIIFNTSNNLRNNAIVLLLWILISFVTLSIVIWNKWTRIGKPIAVSDSQSGPGWRGVEFVTNSLQKLRDLVDEWKQ